MSIFEHITVQTRSYTGDIFWGYNKVAAY